MTRVSVSASVLNWALERSGRPEAIRARFTKLPEWLSGKSQPTLRQLEDFAKATHTPLGYFFLPNPPEDTLPIPHFRTQGEKKLERPSADLLETVRTMLRRQAWMREYLIEQGHEALRFVRSRQNTDNPEQIAREIRDVLHLSEGWAKKECDWTAALRALQTKAENAGILVVVNAIVGNNTHRKLNPDEFRGFVLVDEYAPLVFINGADGKAAQMFTLAHELAHIWLGSSAAFDLRNLQPASDETEQACNRIAAEFLVPESEFKRFWPSVRDQSDCFQRIACRFKVSELVAARRAFELQMIKKTEFLNFYKKYQERERRVSTRQAGGDFYATQNLRLSRRFAEAVIRAVKEGKLLYHEAYRLTGLYGKTFEQYAKYLSPER
ncbi:MAG: ImmA/IrrE family metallo-endopeptidase [Sandaracinaceae bacterium]|nr:ImmA/IrrE family metallo-endopeptidase [Sandaracinaceae bacterium]MDW8245143.1 ImmA/IrrE family metallo-endopeptidase [Sandaracinaceae bacterium]